MPPNVYLIDKRATKYIFVTGGVVSSVGKGIATAALGRILKSRGLSVAIQKLDPYLNVDPGTMSPYQHGEVFVTHDGTETDLDLGHYERFLDVDLTRSSSVSTGQIYQTVLAKERRGDYLGGTIQPIPHVTNEIKGRIRAVARESQADVVILEVGGRSARNVRPRESLNISLLGKARSGRKIGLRRSANVRMPCPAPLRIIIGI